jgi:hypothetical protein
MERYRNHKVYTGLVVWTGSHCGTLPKAYSNGGGDTHFAIHPIGSDGAPNPCFKIFINALFYRKYPYEVSLDRKHAVTGYRLRIYGAFKHWQNSEQNGFFDSIGHAFIL